MPRKLWYLPFSATRAGVAFGRDAEIVEALNCLRSRSGLKRMVIAADSLSTPHAEADELEARLDLIGPVDSTDRLNREASRRVHPLRIGVSNETAR